MIEDPLLEVVAFFVIAIALSCSMLFSGYNIGKRASENQPIYSETLPDNLKRLACKIDDKSCHAEVDGLFNHE